jgi:hypothetical protein
MQRRRFKNSLLLPISCGLVAKPPRRSIAGSGPSRTDLARQVAEEYASDLREIITKLREKLN